MIYKSYTIAELMEAIAAIKNDFSHDIESNLGKIHFGPLKRELHIYTGDGAARYDYNLETKELYEYRN